MADHSDLGFQPAPHADLGFTPTPKPQDTEGPVSRFISNAAEQANPITLLQGMGESLMHPIEAGKRYLEQNADLANKTAESFKNRHYLEGVRHGLNLALNAVPGLGAASDAAGNQINEGDVAGGLGKATGAGLAVVEGSKLPAVARGAAEVIHATPGAIGTVARVVTDPGVVRAGVKILPKGPAMLDFADKIKAAKNAVSGAASPVTVTSQPTAAPEIPPAAASIVEKAQAAPPLTPAEQSLADHIMANVEPEAAVPPAAGPASIPLQGPADMPAAPVGQSAMPATPAAALQMPRPQGAPVPASPAEAVSQAPQVQVIPSPEPAVPKEVYVAKAQAAKSTKMADVLHQLEIMPDQVPTISDADWTRIEKATKINRPNSPESLQMVVEKLQNLQKPSAAAEVPEALRKNPAAMKAAMDVRDELAKPEAPKGPEIEIGKPQTSRRNGPNGNWSVNETTIEVRPKADTTPEGWDPRMGDIKLEVRAKNEVKGTGASTPKAKDSVWGVWDAKGKQWVSASSMTKDAALKAAQDKVTELWHK